VGFVSWLTDRLGAKSCCCSCSLSRADITGLGASVGTGTTPVLGSAIASFAAPSR
jgi:hypothetical protein